MLGWTHQKAKRAEEGRGRWGERPYIGEQDGAKRFKFGRSYPKFRAWDEGLSDVTHDRIAAAVSSHQCYFGVAQEVGIVKLSGRLLTVLETVSEFVCWRNSRWFV